MLISSTVITSLILAPVLYAATQFIRWFFAFRRKYAYWKKLPHFETHWLWGNLHTHPGPNRNGMMYLRENIRKHPHMYVEWYGPFDARVSVHHPDTVKLILKSSEPKPLAKGVSSYRLLLEWLGDGLLISRGAKWARNRRLLTPAFHFDILKPYMAINNKCTDIFLEKVSKWAKAGDSFDIFGNISLLTLDVILRCAYSYEVNCQTDGYENKYAHSVFRLCHIISDRFMKPWLIDSIFNLTSDGREHQNHCDFVHQITDTVIKKRKQILAESGDRNTTNCKHLDFLDILLKAKDEDGKGLTDTEIRAEADTFLFEGHDTTASGISWLLYALATHPECQRKCQEEIDNIIKGKSTDYIEWDDLPKLQYLGRCIKESQRMYSTVPFIGRELTEDMEIDGYLVPKGSRVEVRIWCLHHNEAVWEDDMIFNPERFLPDAIEKMDTFAYVPFSAGPRNCIGQNFALHEMKTVVARILHKYNIELDPNQKVEERMALVLKTQEQVNVKAIPRK